MESTTVLKALAAARGGKSLATLTAELLLPKPTRFEKRTASALIGGAKLREGLREARRAGHCVEINQTGVGVTRLAAPVFDSREVQAAIGLSVPASGADRMRVKKWLKLVRQGAARITNSLRSSSRSDPRRESYP